MKMKRVLAIKAESIEEEQNLMKEFSEAYWNVPSTNGGFATFYIPESYALRLDEMIQEGKLKK